MTGSAPAPRRATRREWIGLAVIALPCMIYSMDLTVLNLAVPTLTADLKPTASQMLWIIDIYGFMVAGFLLPMGTLGDRIGRRRLLLIGAAAFGAASVVAAFASSASMLIALRALLGIAGATLAPSTLSLISNMFPDERERTFAISMWVASFSLGAILGPLIGGLLIEFYWWGSVFLIAVPPMLLLLAIGPRLLPEYRAADAGRLDLFSALLSLGAVLSAIFGIKRLAEQGLDTIAAASIAAGIGLALVFLRRQKRLADPMVDLTMFANPAFSAALAINMAGILFMFGSFVFFAQYLQLVAGLSPLEAGLWSLPSAIAFTLASFGTSPLANRFPPAWLMIAGMAVAALGFVWLAFAGSLVAIVASTVVFSIGFTPVVTLATGMVIGAAPPDRAGMASGMSETAAELGGALGIALLGSLGAAIYRLRLETVPLGGLSADSAAAARATLGGALASAPALPAESAAALVAAARAAFMSGFQVVALFSIAGMIFCAVVAFRQLRHIRPAGH